MGRSFTHHPIIRNHCVPSRCPINTAQTPSRYPPRHKNKPGAGVDVHSDKSNGHVILLVICSADRMSFGL